ncbi:MAG TPA: glycosyltransferase family 4 protein [Candidatus Saccharimonadales bacterium]|jgi:glycosyltransferase involved in cell wall biosynthesis|nr:glycosyltransferase family 4 protein [Candidatus Saccharimonadales bacterium]
MRPLLVDLGRDYRGGQDQALLLLKGLVAQGHAPELITIRGSLLALRAQSVGIHVHSVEKRWRRLASVFAIRELLSRRRVDIVHANEPHSLTSAWLARAHHRVPLVASRRVIFPLSKSAVSLARYRAAVKIIAVSQCVSSALINSGLRAGDITVISDGVPAGSLSSQADRAEARRSMGIEPDALLIGCIAALTPDKGQEILIRAFAQVRARFPGCQLLLVGDGPCRAKLEALVPELDLNGAVHFTGFLENLQNAYAAIDLFAFLAQAEALGTALLLAMANGLPVVASALGGIPEIVEDGKNGALIKNQTPEAVASAIVRIFGDSAFSARMGSAARETILARFSQEIMVNQTLRLYEQLVAGRTIQVS